MHFDKIKFDGSTVENDYEEPLQGGGTKMTTDHGKNPSPAFKAALQAFSSFVLWVHSWPADMGDRLEVRGVTIKRSDDKPRGVIVTAVLKCPHARNSTSTINTPYLAEPPENYNGSGDGFVPLAVRDLIDALEARATEFHDGERGDQIPLALGASENTKAFADRSAAAEGKSTRKPKKNDFVPGVGEIMNPDAVVADITDEQVRQLLMMVERDVPVDAIHTWVSSERNAAIAWATAQQKRLAGSLKPAEIAAMPKEPPVIKASATMPLGLAKPASSTTSRTVQ